MSRAQGKSHVLRKMDYELQNGSQRLTRKQARRLRKKDNSGNGTGLRVWKDEINPESDPQPSAQIGQLGTAIGMALWNLSGGRMLRATRHPGTKNRTPKRKRK